MLPSRCIATISVAMLVVCNSPIAYEWWSSSLIHCYFAVVMTLGQSRQQWLSYREENELTNSVEVIVPHKMPVCSNHMVYVVSSVLMKSVWGVQQVLSTNRFQKRGEREKEERAWDSTSSMTRSAKTTETGEFTAVLWTCWWRELRKAK